MSPLRHHLAILCFLRYADFQTTLPTVILQFSLFVWCDILFLDKYSWYKNLKRGVLDTHAEV
jgi:hypothetical protein